MKLFSITLMFIAALVATNANADQSYKAPPMTLTTLGTAGGPIVRAHRSQPSDLLTVKGQHWLVDCGDGCLERLAAAHLHAPDVSRLFITHLHMDHIGGVMGLIGLRWMLNAKHPLIIYGPPGTKTLVKGIVAGLQPTQRIRLGVELNGHRRRDPIANTVKVVIVKGGSDLDIDGVRVRALQNSHFDVDGHHVDNGSQSLSYRFDYDNYSIGITGDTGPYKPLADFFRNVNVMISEVIDLPPIIANIHSPHSPMPKSVAKVLIKHLETQHITPQEAGTIAANAHVGRLVFTHLAAIGPTNKLAPKLVAEAHETYKGEVTVARDMDIF